MTREQWATKILDAYSNDHSETCTHERIAIVVDEIIAHERGNAAELFCAAASDARQQSKASIVASLRTLARMLRR